VIVVGQILVVLAILGLSAGMLFVVKGLGDWLRDSFPRS
jgi:hypothetical protein